jgi:hypothetical protein
MLTQDKAKALFEIKNEVLCWRYNGKQAGGTNGVKAPYLRVCVDGIRYMVHKVVYLIHHGFMPEIVDHVDGNIKNNSVSNLRAATKSQNALNKKIRFNSITGVKNVTQDKTTGRYKVHLTINKKRKHFGTFDDLELAELVAIEAQSKFYGVFASYTLKGN